MSGPAPFLHRHIWHDAAPDPAKQALGTLSGGEICFAVITFIGCVVAAMVVSEMLLRAMKGMYEEKDQSGFSR